jgi:hypothetical protein
MLSPEWGEEKELRGYDIENEFSIRRALASAMWTIGRNDLFMLQFSLRTLGLDTLTQVGARY